MPFPTATGHETIRAVFIATWMVLFAGTLIFFGAAPPRWKRAVWPWTAIGTAALFLLFVYLMDGAKTHAYFFVVPFVVLIAANNLKTVKFCPKCGCMNRRMFAFSSPKYCMHCANTLD